ncbi:MAG TPA: PKD domain-containing protein [Flavilitoribacter sp.]|nr:PKD domain-containing protein [Flavilitoribacter sp.]
MSARFFLFFGLLLSGKLICQPEISGVINQYARYQGTGSCPNSILVDQPAFFPEGSALLIIQMQGATIEEDNDSGFGNVTNLGGAGNYEINRVFAVNGNELVLEKNLLGPYSTGGNTQVVRVPEYDDVRVAGPVTAMPWNGQTGGVIALNVSGTLWLDAGLNASGAGFRGGASITVNSNCTFLTAANRYYYESGNWRGAPKGEGIAPVISGKELGRGAQANGGGGGNDHNSGGGGGANVAGGGQGGENDEPSFGGCDGFYPGKGGKGPSLTNTALIMGGGGGAGHQNNNAPSAGGNGGGVIVLQAGTVVFSGGSIQCNGISAQTVIGDGGGGGGGGGSIALGVGSFSGTPSIEAKGGSGGNVDNSGDDRCQGPGGGGSGGRLISSLTVSADLAGGAAGLSTNSGSCPEGPNGAEAGSTGQSITVAELNQSEASPAPAIAGQPADTSFCTGSPLVLTVNATGQGLAYQWQIQVAGGGFQDLASGPDFSGVNSAALQTNNLPGQTAAFRLVLGNDCFGYITTEPATVTAAPQPAAGFDFTANGLTVQFNNTSQNGLTYSWSSPQAPGFASTDPDPTYTFAASGIYEVELTATNACGSDQSVQTIALGQNPKASFVLSGPGTGCAPLTVQFQNQSTGAYDQILWEFPGGAPNSSAEENPTVTYAEPGSYDVSLTLSGPLGESTSTHEDFIEVAAPPLPDFQWSSAGLTVSFENQSSNATAFSWIFGDGQNSFDSNPVHTYAQPGIYDVTLNAQNPGCGVSVTHSVLLQSTGVQAPAFQELVLFPNPTDSGITVNLKTGNAVIFRYRLITLAGATVQQGELTTPGYISLEQLPQGTYGLEIEIGGQKRVDLILKN